MGVNPIWRQFDRPWSELSGHRQWFLAVNGIAITLMTAADAVHWYLTGYSYKFVELFQAGPEGLRRGAQFSIIFLDFLVAFNVLHAIYRGKAWGELVWGALVLGVVLRGGYIGLVQGEVPLFVLAVAVTAGTLPHWVGLVRARDGVQAA